LTIFFLFLDRTAGQRVLLAAYLAGSGLRPGRLPCVAVFPGPAYTSDCGFCRSATQTALYLHHWLMALSFVVCMGNVTEGVMRLAGAAELTVIKSWMVGAVIVAGMLIWMLLQKRKVSGQPHSARVCRNQACAIRLAQNWHHLCRRCYFAVVGCQHAAA
jgi:hypothetical protein